jgi:hypothetical protein
MKKNDTPATYNSVIQHILYNQLPVVKISYGVSHEEAMFQALPNNIRLGWKYFPKPNTLAYRDKLSIQNKEKFFTKQMK